MNPIYAVIDTNVLVSSLFSKDGLSNPAIVIHAVITGLITPLYNEEIIDEYREVLSRKKFNFNKKLIESLVSAFTDFGISTERESAEGEKFIDHDDIVFFEVALSKQPSYLVTGNIKHFPKKPFVLTPAEMVDILVDKGLIQL